MNRSLFRLGLSAVLALVLAVVSTPPVHAQGSNTSTINGRVTDSSGGVLPGATINAKHVATGVVSTTVTNAEGSFSLPSLPPGTYEVTVSLEGFKQTVISNVVITAAQGATVNASLEVGGVTEQVTVASSSEIIQTQSTTISSTIGTNQITKLPLTTRSAMDFVNFLPGVSTPGGNRQATINGLPQGVINITLDGINIQDNTNRSTDGFFAIVSPRLDAVEEVSVTTAGQGADAGQGAVQIKFTTRSGGNNYSGSAYHYYRNDKLNANTWFNNRSGTAKPELLQNQFGARFGGPLIVPGLLDRGKAFFFGNYEELRQPSDTTRNRNVMTTAAQAGNFTYGGGRTFNVLDFAVSRGLASTSTPDPTVAQLLNDIRAAAANAGTLEFLDANVDQVRINFPVESKRIFPTGRVDYNITDNHRFSTSVNYNWFNDFPDTLNNREASFPGLPVEAGQSSTRLGWSSSLRSTLGRNLVNEFRVGYSGAPVQFFKEMSTGMYTGSIANTKGFHVNFPALTSNLTGPGAAPAPQSRDANDLAFDNNLTWLKGNHNITAGASLSMYKVWLKNSALVPAISFGITTADPANAAFSAANIAAYAGATPSNAELTAARNLFALLTGRISQIAGDARLDENTGLYTYMGAGIQRASMDEYGFFLQDSWRWRPNFTVNAGLRYSLQMPFTAANNSYSTTTMEDVCGRSGVDASTGYCNLFQPGNMPGKTRPEFYNLAKGERAYNTDWDNWAPNVGFAWTPSRREGFLGTLMSDELVIRGGWSRAFSREGMGRYTGEINSNPGVVITATRNEGLGNLNAAPLLYRNDSELGAPSFAERPNYPLTDVITQDIRIFDPNLEVPHADSWSFGIQRKVSTNMALEVRYVGTRSDNAFATRNFNEINIVENNFLAEFQNAQRNLQANIAAGRGNTFAYTGAAGTVPLPIFLAHLNARPTDQAGDPALYTGNNWTNNSFLQLLAAQNPNPYGFANNASTGNAATTALLGNATFRNNAINAGLPRNFWVANPEQLGGAIVVLNSHKTRYHSLQVELRRRLAQGLQFQSSYVYGRAMQTVFLSHRNPLVWRRDTGSPGDLAHQFKLNMVYDLPFGQGRRFMGGAGPVLDRIVGGWQIGFNTKIQSGQLVDVGNVRLVGWTADDVQKAFKLRFENDAKQIFMFPEDVVTNTIRAFSASPTSATGYSGTPPTGRYFAPAGTPTCAEVVPGSGECGGVGSLILQGPVFEQSDLRVAKRTNITSRVNFEIAAETLNVFNRANFVPNGQASSATLTNYLVTGLTGTNTSRTIQIVSRINW